MGIANWPIEGKKAICFCQTMTTHRNVDIVQILTHEHPLCFSHDKLNMAIAPYRYTLKRTAKLWGSLGFCSVSSDNFFVVTYTCLSLVLTFDFCSSQLIFLCVLFKQCKNKQVKNANKSSKKIEFIKERWESPAFKLCRGSCGSTFKFWKGSWCPTFKLWGCPESEGSEVPVPRVLILLLHHALAT